MPEVSVIIVCMNRPDILFPCLDSIRAHTTVSHEVLVVAYLFSPENLAEVRTKYPYVKLVESTEIRGFSENNNLALRQARGRFCFVVNDDTLMSVSVIDRLVRDLEQLPEPAAAISPCIRLSDGRIQTCGRTPWTPWRYAKHYLHLVNEGDGPGRHTSRNRLRFAPAPPKVRAPHSRGPLPLRRPRVATDSGMCAPGAVRQTYTLNGACFLIKREAFEKVGWFDERYFFTPEDIALGHTLNAAGYTVWVDPDVEITHLAGGSVSALEAAIKPARVRGSLIFYGEPLWLKCFIWLVELARFVKNSLVPGRSLYKQSARNVMRAVFSRETPKELFIRFK